MIKAKMLVIVTVVLSAFVVTVSAGRIHEAVKRGDVAEVDSLLAKDPKLVEAKDNKSRGTPLHWAAGYGHKKIVEILIANGANVNERDNEGKTALHYAAFQGHREVVGLLRKHGGVK